MPHQPSTPVVVSPATPNPTDGAAPIRSFGLIMLACLATAACIPTTGALVGRTLETEVVQRGYPPLPRGYCYVRGRAGEILYEANDPAMGRCASGRVPG
jgi:hypothetical protein